MCCCGCCGCCCVLLCADRLRASFNFRPWLGLVAGRYLAVHAVLYCTVYFAHKLQLILAHLPPSIRQYCVLQSAYRHASQSATQPCKSPGVQSHLVVATRACGTCSLHRLNQRRQWPMVSRGRWLCIASSISSACQAGPKRNVSGLVSIASIEMQCSAGCCGRPCHRSW